MAPVWTLRLARSCTAGQGPAGGHDSHRRVECEPRVVELVLALDGRPGQVYEPRGWELWTGLAPLYAAGRHAEVAERLRAIVAEHPQYPLLFFNLACAESLIGEEESAIDHLRQAIALNDEFRGYAQDDSDLASLRDDPRFKELAGS